jgi:AcrR family transcriptional regulator
MTSPGRPRDPRVDDALRRAVQDLLVADGYHGLTVQGVAR